MNLTLSPQTDMLIDRIQLNLSPLEPFVCTERSSHSHTDAPIVAMPGAPFVASDRSVRSELASLPMSARFGRVAGGIERQYRGQDTGLVGCYRCFSRRQHRRSWLCHCRTGCRIKIFFHTVRAGSLDYITSNKSQNQKLKWKSQSQNSQLKVKQNRKYLNNMLY